MPVGKLFWSTPTGAMLWELWARQKRLFITQAVVIIFGSIFAQFSAHLSLDNRTFWLQLTAQVGGFGILQTLTCFCYMEADARRLQGGIPSYLLIKPVATLRLVMVPMLSGGVVVLAVFLAWAELIWRPLGYSAVQVPWICTLLLSFTWCVQAVVWSTANFPWLAQTFLVLLTAGIHLLVGLIPLMPKPINLGWRLGLVGALMACAFPIAIIGVQRVREGRWEGGASRRPTSARPSVPGKPKPFRSAFWAQFWLEWRRQGLALPLLTGLGVLCLILTDVAVRIALPEPGDDAPTGAMSFTMLILNYVIFVPLLCSVVMGSTLGIFDLTHSSNIFIAIRPITNGGFVLAKLMIAAVTSLLTWFLVLGMVSVWLGLTWHATLIPELSHLTMAKLIKLAVLFFCSFTLMVLLTWRNQVGGMWVGLTGRPAFIVSHSYFIKFPVYLGAVSIYFQLISSSEFQATFARWLPWVLGVAFTLKLLVSGVAFYWSLRRKATTPGAIGWIAGGWFVAGLFIAILAQRICADIKLPVAWALIAVASFYLLPLAELAIAPMALTWNRHR